MLESYRYDDNDRLTGKVIGPNEDVAGGTVVQKYFYNDGGLVESITSQNPSIPTPGDIYICTTKTAILSKFKRIHHPTELLTNIQNTAMTKMVILHRQFAIG